MLGFSTVQLYAQDGLKLTEAQQARMLEAHSQAAASLRKARSCQGLGAVSGSCSRHPMFFNFLAQRIGRKGGRPGQPKAAHIWCRKGFYAGFPFCGRPDHTVIHSKRFLCSLLDS